MAKRKEAKGAAPETKAPAADLRKARLEELERDQLSVFFYLALPPERAVALLKRLNVTLTGFRPEGLGGIEKSDLIADEFRGYPEHRKAILQAAAKEIGELPDTSETLGMAAKLLAPLFAVEGGAAKAIARMLVDPDNAVRTMGLEVLDSLADYYLGEVPPEEEGAASEPEAAPGSPAPDPTEALRRELERARERADAAEHERAARAEQLQAARREVAESQAVIGELRRVLAAAEADRDRLGARVEALEAGNAPTEQRLRREISDLKERIGKLEEERRVLRVEKARLEVALGRAPGAEAKPPEPPKRAPPPPGEPEGEVVEEAPPTWLMPVFTKEFYDSLPGWERRLQRAAFTKAMLLAQDHRHPSLRALPLEGLPNLYRIRIATDVRLLYRRGEGNVIEILRLIDREDLDRWIKVEKLRT